ncbi:MAG: radical SAM protein [Rhodospirillales bacterium]|nr:radical SAM protein [Rhodospirillales bacterium]
MPEGAYDFKPLDPAKFKDPLFTAKGEARAWVDLARLHTLWFNTGSLCNITCANCYMDSGPKKDDLAYLNASHVRGFLDEIKALNLPTEEIGFTGGEPFMNKALPDMLGDVLERGFKTLVLTNAMKPLWHNRDRLLALNRRFGAERLTLRVSIDHPTPAIHEQERGPGTWAPLERSVKWLIEHGFRLDVAGRALYCQSESEARAAYQRLFGAWGLDLDAQNPARLVLFPEMDEAQDVPEITTACWAILNVRPDAQMCATSRMVVLRKGDLRPRVVPCTLLPYDPAFDLGSRLAEAQGAVRLNHPHCAKFCVLGGASCSSR